MRPTLTVAFCLQLFLLAGCASDPFAPEPGADRAGAVAEPVDAAAGRTRGWIVVLKSDVTHPGKAAREMLGDRQPQRVFGSVLKGFSGRMTDGEAERLRQDPRVAYVEEDAILRTAGGPLWNLERIQPRAMVVGTRERTHFGAGVTAYVIDTGIRSTHVDFGGRVAAGFDAIDGDAADDCNGHGTHVAGTIGGAAHGAATEVTIVPVRVLDCWGEGTVSEVVAGIDWMVEHAQRPAVANLSLEGAPSRAVDEAVERAIAAGIVVVVAAGNAARDACDYSPARAPAAMTVGASTAADAAWALSNQGACVDLFAPGAEILSAGAASDTTTMMMSGTSMAAPHVTAAAALVLERHPGATPAQVRQTLVAQSTVLPTARLTRLWPESPDLMVQLPLEF